MHGINGKTRELFEISALVSFSNFLQHLITAAYFFGLNRIFP